MESRRSGGKPAAIELGHREKSEEIVVCVRKSEAERFRIPQELRELEVTPQNEAWAARAEGTLSAGQQGIGSCSAVGIGGATGCFGQAADRNRAERRANRNAQPVLGN